MHKKIELWKGLAFSFFFFFSHWPLERLVRGFLWKCDLLTHQEVICHPKSFWCNTTFRLSPKLPPFILELQKKKKKKKKKFEQIPREEPNMMKIDLKQVECECWVLFSCREKWTRSSSESPKLNFISNSLFQSPCGCHKVLHVLCYLTLILHLIAQNKYKGVHILRWTCTAEGTLTSLLAPWKLFRIPLKKKKKNLTKGGRRNVGHGGLQASWQTSWFLWH